MKKYENYSYVSVQAQRHLTFGAAHIVKKSLNSPSVVTGKGTYHHLELSLGVEEGGAYGCFPDYWDSERFEPFGQIFFIPAGQNICLKSERKNEVAISCSFHPKIFHDWFDDMPEWTESRLKRIFDIKNNNIRTLLLHLSEHLKSGIDRHGKALAFVAEQIGCELVRHVKTIDEAQIPGGLSPWRMNLIERRIATFDSQPTLEELAELCHLSVRQLTRAFRLSRGQSLGNHIASRRAEHAKLLLSAGMSVKLVAYTMGFSEPSNFTHFFIRVTGQKPKVFREDITRYH